MRSFVGLSLMLVSLSFPLTGCTVHGNPQGGTTPTTPVAAASQWAVAGQNESNTRNQPSETVIGVANASTLAQKWMFTAGASVSATPTVDGSNVYFPDWAGNLFAVDRKTGKQVWSAKVSSYDGVSGAVSRVSPAIAGTMLIFGDNQGELGPHAGANLIAIDASSGKLKWITKVDSHPAAIITGSAIVSGSVVYQGVSSAEEQYATSASYACCTFRGSVVALDIHTGKILWKTYDMPDNGGSPTQYSGGGIWQPPVVDAKRGMVYVATGNNYSVPTSVMACQADDWSRTDCTASDDYFESVIGLDIKTGALRWSHRFSGYDTWTVACVGYPGNPCPSPAGPDYDFGGSGGNMLNGLVGFGQKSGMYYALNPADGTLAWKTPVGPGGNNGGIIWGTATDGQRIYIPLTNNEHTSYALASGQTVTGSVWAALDPATGKFLWQMPDPNQSQFDAGAVSVANGVLYAGTQDGHMYAMDASSGKILWTFSSGGTVLDGPAIVDGVVYWGSGYARSGGIANNKVYAFSVGGK